MEKISYLQLFTNRLNHKTRTKKKPKYAKTREKKQAIRPTSTTDDDDDDDDDDDGSKSEQVPDPQPGFEILSIREQNIRKYRTVGRDYKIRVGGYQRRGSYNDILFHIANVFAELLARLLRDVEDQDRVRLVIS